MELASVGILCNTTVFYLPPNKPSQIQPCDAGIIQSLKAYYQRRLNHIFVYQIVDKVSDHERVDVIEAMHIAVVAWIMYGSQRQTTTAFAIVKFALPMLT